MARYHVQLLGPMVNASALVAMNTAGEILATQTVVGKNGGAVPAKGICGFRFQALSGKRLPLYYAVPEGEAREVFVRAINNRGEIVGGYLSRLGNEGSHGLLWDSKGKCLPLSGGAGKAINDAGQILTDESRFTDGQSFGSDAIRLRPGAASAATGPLALKETQSPAAVTGYSINRKGAVVGPGMTLWQPGQYGQGQVVETANADNTDTTFAGGKRPVITENGIIVCLGTAPAVPAEKLRFHRWKQGASSTAVPLRLPADSQFRQQNGTIKPGLATLTTVAANTRGDILLNLKQGRQTEALLWHPDGQVERLPQIDAGVLLNDSGWIVGTSLGGRFSYILLRPA